MKYITAPPKPKLGIYCIYMECPGVTLQMLTTSTFEILIYFDTLFLLLQYLYIQSREISVINYGMLYKLHPITNFKLTGYLSILVTYFRGVENV